jgi:hypothetical protein
MMFDPKRICTPIIERSNLSLRMGQRRWIRLTNAFGRKWENQWAAAMPWYTYYNFCRIRWKSGLPITCGIFPNCWPDKGNNLLNKSAGTENTGLMLFDAPVQHQFSNNACAHEWVGIWAFLQWINQTELGVCVCVLRTTKHQTSLDLSQHFFF